MKVSDLIADMPLGAELTKSKLDIKKFHSQVEGTKVMPITS